MAVGLLQVQGAIKKEQELRPGTPLRNAAELVSSGLWEKGANGMVWEELCERNYVQKMLGKY